MKCLPLQLRGLTITYNRVAKAFETVFWPYLTYALATCEADFTTDKVVNVCMK